MIKVNEYFGGTVKSLGYASAIGNSTVGVMVEGTYEFNTGAPEVMVVIEGELQVQLKGESTWTSYKDGQKFDVPGNSSFQVKSVGGNTSYLCQFK